MSNPSWKKKKKKKIPEEKVVDRDRREGEREGGRGAEGGKEGGVRSEGYVKYLLGERPCPSQADKKNCQRRVD